MRYPAETERVQDASTRPAQGLEPTVCGIFSLLFYFFPEPNENADPTLGNRTKMQIRDRMKMRGSPLYFALGPFCCFVSSSELAMVTH